MRPRSGAEPQFVFGYGSLVAAPPRAAQGFHPPGFAAELSGFARGWGVAMDNSVDLPGYKFYERPDGSRPDVFVAFLDLTEDPAPGASVNGRCVAVDDRGLARLDLRERNYVRLDVSDRLDRPAARVWTYVGTPAARRRLREGRRRGRAVIAAGYLRSVMDGFRALGRRELEACRGSLDPGGLPVMELIRRDLDPGA